MNDGLAALEGTTPKEIAEASAGNLLPVPWIEPEDVANAVLYLASDRHDSLPVHNSSLMRDCSRAEAVL